MSDQIEILREAPAAWDARLEQAYVASEIAELPFTQTAAWATSKALTGWEAVRIVAIHPSGGWAGAQLLLQHLPGPLGRFAYAPRAPRQRLLRVRCVDSSAVGLERRGAAARRFSLLR